MNELKMKGYIPTAGYAESLLSKQTATEDSSVVQFLKDSGAIPFCTTNVPQTLFTFDCANPIYGRTFNPVDATRSPGGSSGGEGALLGYGGSILGFGGDVAGSIRVPANYCGVVGFKPGTYFGFQKGSAPSIPGRPMIYGSVGPLARDVEAIAMICNAIVNDAPPKPPVYWPEEVDIFSSNSEKPLKIGVMITADMVSAMPDCRKAVETAAQIFENVGCQVVSWEPPEPEKIPVLYYGACAMDGGEYLRKRLSQDIVDEPYRRALNFLSKSSSVLGVELRIRQIFDKNAAVQVTYHKSTSTLRQIYQDIESYLVLYTRKWEEMGLDAVVSPIMPASAPEVHEHLMLEPLYAYYNIVCNMLNCPAGCVPVLKCGAGPSLRECNNVNKFEKKIWKNGSKPGLPIGVQVMTLPYEEKLCLKVMKMVEDGVKAGSSRRQA